MGGTNKVQRPEAVNPPPRFLHGRCARSPFDGRAPVRRMGALQGKTVPLNAAARSIPALLRPHRHHCRRVPAACPGSCLFYYIKVAGFHFGGLPPVGGTEPWKPCRRRRTEACPRAAERPHLGNHTLEIPSTKPPCPDRPLFRHQPGRYARHPANAPPEQAKFAGRNIPGIQRLVRHVKRRPFPDEYMPGNLPQISLSLFRGLFPAKGDIHASNKTYIQPYEI